MRHHSSGTFTLFSLLLFSLIPQTLSAQEDHVWPGFTPRAFLIAESLIRDNGWVMLLLDDGEYKNVWVKEIHYVIQKNGFLAMKINGQRMIASRTYINYGGSVQNLEALFTLKIFPYTGDGPLRLPEFEESKLW
jgi:hypothetical protein